MASTFCEKMNAQQEERFRWIKIALLAIPLFIIGTMAMAPVQVGRSVLDSAGNPVLHADGTKMVKTDHWGNFKVNWPGYTLMYGSIVVFIWGVGGWLVKGFAARSKAMTAESE